MKRVWPLFVLCLFKLLTSPVKAIDFNIQAATPSGNTVDITAVISGATNTNCPSQTCYLFAALRQGSGNYFGETQNNQGEWIAYISKPEKEFIKVAYYLINLTDGVWNGIVRLRFDPADTAYAGPENYTLNLMRFTGNSQSAAESTTTSVALTEPKPSPSPSPEASPASSPNNSTNSSPSPSASPIISPAPTTFPSPQPSKIYRIKDIVLLRPSPEPEVLGTASGKSKQSPGKPNWQLITMLLLTGTGLVSAAAIIIIRLWRQG